MVKDILGKIDAKASWATKFILVIIGVTVTAMNFEGWEAAFGVGYMVAFLYFYHLKKTNNSYHGVKVDFGLLMIPLIISLWFFIRGLFVDTKIKKCGENCKVGTIDDKEICIEIDGGDPAIPCETNNMNQQGFWKSPQIIIAVVFGCSWAFITYETGARKGWKESGVAAIVILFAMAVIFGTIYILFEIGNPYHVFTDNEDIETIEQKRNDYIFKGGFRGNFLDSSILTPTKLLYDGNPRTVKILNKTGNENGETEPIACSQIDASGNIFLWNCKKSTAHNRIESKCGGDWWITTEKGCLSDGFTNFYRFIYLLIVSILVAVSMYSTFASSTYYTFGTFQPMIYFILTLCTYHVIYLCANLFVSWTHGESILFQDFVSEFLKGRSGYWTNNEECDTKYKTRKDPESEQDETARSGLENEYNTIWDKEGATSKFKIIINMIIFLSVIGYTVNYIGNKYIQQVINSIDILEGKAKSVYLVLITLLVSFSIIQFMYLIYSTVMIDECMIDRITEVTHKIDEPMYQKYCKGIIDENNPACNVDTKEDCIANSSNCIYDNSYTIYELIRCQLDRHGGLLYHIVILLFVPIIFSTIKSAHITDYFK